ncbi:MAG: ATP-binding cassette domain-containing protein [Bacilli bacterium]|nr:ATP-binding cassette domain-containing protein [Bacilli bacterium]
MVSLNVLGLYDQYQDKWRESINLPNPFSIHTYIDNREQNVLINPPLNHKISLNIFDATFSRETEFEDSIIKSTRFVSSDERNLLVNRYVVTSKKEATIDINLKVDLDIYEINGPHFVSKEIEIKDNVIHFQGVSNENKKINTYTLYKSNVPLISDNNGLKIEKTVKKDEEIIIEIYSYIGENLSSLLHLANLGFKVLLENHKKKFNKEWKISRVEIDDESAQFEIDYSIYHLLILMDPDSVNSIPARGLSGQTYKGAIFWDVFLKAAEGLKLKPSECLVIEDAFAGIDAGKAGQFISIGIGDAAKYEKADYKIEKLSELVKLVEEINNKLSHKIDIEHLVKIYPNSDIKAVNDFNLTIDNEEFVVFVGPSGCGKSTVLRMIAGLEEITEGEIYLDGRLLNNLDPKDRNIAMVFQNYALYPHLSVRKNIAFPLANEKIPFKYFFNFKWRKERRERINQIVEDTAAKINLSEYLDRKPANLSGGQRQRVALGRAIVRNPKVFLLDEPLSNLDAKMRVQMRSEITRLHQQLKTVFIYVTHDQVEAMTMGTKIVVLKSGVIQQVASPEELFINPVNMFVAGFIGTPQMNFIKGIVHKKGDKYLLDMLGVNSIELPSERMKTFNEEFLDKEVIIGVRPRAISVKGDLEYVEQGYTAKISLFEQLGEETNVYASIEGHDKDLIIATTGLGRFENEEEINISFNFKDICLFDPISENKLL